MPLTNLLKSAAGTCRYCGQKAGILSRDHSECSRIHQAGWNEMVELVAQAARSRQFDEKSLRLSLADIAQRSYGDGMTVNQALEQGWKRGVDHAMADGIITQAEESRLREFRERLAMNTGAADPQAAASMERASKDRFMLDARLAAIATEDGQSHLDELSEALRTGIAPEERTALLNQSQGGMCIC